MTIPDDIVTFSCALGSLGVGLFVTAVGFGLAVVPPSVPILGAATHIASWLYLITGSVITILGMSVSYLSFKAMLGNSAIRRGGFTRR